MFAIAYFFLGILFRGFIGTDAMDFVKMAKCVKKDFPRAQFFFVGDGPLIVGTTTGQV
jgi:hypothetical protein